MRLGMGVGLSLVGGSFAWQQHRSTFAESNVSLSPKEFKKVKCIANEEHTHNTHKITFELPQEEEGGGSAWGTGPIANILFRVGGAAKTGKCCGCCSCGADCGCPVGKNGCCGCCTCAPPCTCPKKEVKNSKSITRPYNPISTDADGTVTLVVKRYDESKMGSAMHSLKPGDVVEAKGPNQQWSWKKGKFAHYGMIAGGTGLTPIIQATTHILKHDSSKVTLVCFNQTPADILLKEELEGLAEAYPGRLTVHHVLEKGGRGALQGRVRPSLLALVLPPPGKTSYIMTCGRKEMTETIAGPKAKDWTQGPLGGMLSKMGYEKAHVWKV